MRFAGKVAGIVLGLSTLLGASQAIAQDATPVAPDESGDTFTLVERALSVTIVDVGVPGASAGDIT
ncbi:MAG TPA: hypothetical protein VD767_09900, partial [Thermomicrobiales bacterium]|nr:hypothetical protein [Thermomicrobiales bacterium]